MSRPPITVLKFGGSVLSDESDLPAAVAEIRRHHQAGHRVLAVVSAIGDTTERLLCIARSLAASPDPATLTALLATGEATSAALLALALDAAGLRTAVLDPGRVGPYTRGPLLDADPCGLDADQVLDVLERRPVAVLPGFVGRSLEGPVSVLGRGGSDLTALYAAHVLAADRCRLFKDVPGVFESDPAADGPLPRRYSRLSWNDALAMEPSILQPKAVRLALRYRVVFEVGSPGDVSGTLVGPGATALDTISEASLGGRPPRARPTAVVVAERTG